MIFNIRNSARYIAAEPRRASFKWSKVDYKSTELILYFFDVLFTKALPAIDLLLFVALLDLRALDALLATLALVLIIFFLVIRLYLDI